MEDKELRARIGFAIHQTMNIPQNMEDAMVDKIMALKTESEDFTKSLGPIEEDVK